MSDPTPSELKATNTSLGDLLSEVTRDLSTLIRQETALAKAELRESAGKAAKGVGMLAGAAYGAGMAVLFLSIALWWSLSLLIGGGWSGVVVAVLWAAVALILYSVGRTQVKQIEGAPQTVDTLREIPETLRRNEENR